MHTNSDMKSNVVWLLQQSVFGDVPNYLSASVPPSKFPERHFCSVCGYPFLVIGCGDCSRFCRFMNALLDRDN